MAADRFDLVDLRRIDPSRGMGRVLLAHAPADTARRRRSRAALGSLRTSGGSMLTETYPDEASAQAALEKLAARQRRRGYV